MTKSPLRRVFTTVSLFIVACLVLVAVDGRSWLDPVREGLTEVVSPVTSSLRDASGVSVSSGDVEARLATAEAQNERDTAEIASLRSQLEKQETDGKQQAAEQAHPNLTYTAANVTGTDPTGQQRFIVINRGSDHGIEVGMAVVDPNVYVGQVVKVERAQSRVMLITDPSSSVGAMLLDQRADGVIYGTNDGSVLQMQHVNRDVTPANHEWVVTSSVASSETAMVPPNIPIGIVIGDPEVNQQGDQINLTIQPACEFDTLTVVWIVVAND